MKYFIVSVLYYLCFIKITPEKIKLKIIVVIRNKIKYFIELIYMHIITHTFILIYEDLLNL